jgi:CheY-like chemotaxis protein
MRPLLRARVCGRAHQVMMLDRDIHLARALLVESNPLLRSVASSQLRDVGVGHVTGVSRVHDARLLLERERFDIVLCNREIEGSDISGQDLLDELRREHLLPQVTVFLMVTAQASYQQVVEAAESASDGFLVRPYTTAALGARLLEARNRKRALGDVLRALDAGQTEVALVRAVKRFQEQQPYWLYCGRLAAELFLTLNRPEDSRRLFARLAQARAGAAWARLGEARALMATGDVDAARQTVTEVLAAEPEAADAHDLMGRILIEQCDFDAALSACRRAVELTPGCLLRTQQVGALAFYQGAGELAQKWLDRALSMGLQSKLFDALNLLLLGMLRFDAGQSAGVSAMREQLRRFLERAPESRRLRRFEQAAAALVALGGTQPATALATLQALAAQCGDDDFDLEAANVLLALSARVPEALLPAAERTALIERVGMRFCVSRAMGEVLVASSRHTDTAVQVIRDCQARVSALGEKAVGQAMKGDAQGAVASLLAAGEDTRNARLLEMAGIITRRHQDAIPDAGALLERSAAALRRCCQATSHIAGLSRSGRSLGGLQLRMRSATVAVDGSD